MDRTLTSEINNGKSDWNVMQKRLFKEAAEPLKPASFVQSSGNTASQSDASPYDQSKDEQNIPHDKQFFTRRKDYLELLKSNVNNLGNTELFKNYRNVISATLSNQLKNKIKAFVTNVKLEKDKNIPFDDQINSFINDDIKEDKDYLIQQINKNIEKYNDKVEEALMRSSLGLHTANMWIPPIKSVDDFKNIKIVNLQQHIFTVLMDKLLNKKELEEARQKTNVADVSHHVGGDIKQGFTRFMTWLNKTGDQLGYLPSLQFYVQKILDDVRKLEVLESIEEGLKNKINFIVKGRKGAEATNKLRQNLTKEDNLEVDNDIKSLVDSGIIKPQEAPVEEPVTETSDIAARTLVGPGKIGYSDDVETSLYEQEEVGQVKAKKLEKINEGWKKYQQLNKNKANKEKPDGFILSMS